MAKNLGPLTKPPKKRFEISPNAKVIVRQVAIGVGILSLVAAVVGTVYYVTRLPSLTVTTVSATGGETIDTEEVRTRAESVLEGAYGALIPKRFFLFYPQAAMVAEVEKVERITNVAVERTTRNALHITFSEHVPFALWCGPTEDDACLFLNQDGYAFAVAPDLHGGQFVRYRHAATPPAVGTSVLPPDTFWKTVALTELLAVDHQYIAAVEIDAVGDAYFKLSSGGELRSTLKDDPAHIAENLRTIFASKEFSHLRDTDFNYIDLRFGNKVYVSEVDVALAKATASSTATSSDVFATAPIESGEASDDTILLPQNATVIMGTEAE